MTASKPSVFRISTVPESLNVLLKGQLQFLNSNFDITAVSGAGQYLESVKNREGVKVAEVQMERRIAPWQDLKSLIKLYRLFKKEKPQIIHSITPKAGLLSMVAGKFAGVPIRIHTFTGLLFPYRTGLFQKLLIAMDRVLCACATSILPEGKGVLNDLQAFNITKKPLKVLANGNVNGIDVSYFDPENFNDLHLANLRNQLNIKIDDFVFIFVGRIVIDKGLEELITAFEKLTANNTAIKLLLVGPQEQEIDPLPETVLNQLKDNKNIISVGFQTDVRPFFALANALVFPSHREGFPNVVIQAGAMGLPSIVTDISGCNEIIIPGENGIIIPVKNTVALQEAMLEMYSNKALQEKLSINARTLILERYQNSKVWEAVAAHYTELLNKKL